MTTCHMSRFDSETETECDHCVIHELCRNQGEWRDVDSQNETDKNFQKPLTQSFTIRRNTAYAAQIFYASHLI
jgi:hypothetical protein